MVYTWGEDERNLGDRELKEGSTRLGWQATIHMLWF